MNSTFGLIQREASGSKDQGSLSAQKCHKRSDSLRTLSLLPLHSLIDSWPQHRLLIRHLHRPAFQPGVWLSSVTLYGAFSEGCWLGAGGEDEGTSRTWIAWFVDHFGPGWPLYSSRLTLPCTISTKLHPPLLPLPSTKTPEIPLKLPTETSRGMGFLGYFYVH